MVKTHIHKSSHWTPPSVSRKSSSFKPPTVGIQPATGRWQRNEETAGWRAPLPSKVGKSYLSNSIQAKCDACEGKEKEETPEVQTKLTVGEPGDKYEQEADATAAKVVKQVNSPGFNESVQTKVEPVAEPILMRHGGISGGGVDPGVEQSIEGARGSGQGLSADIKEPMEKAFGADFSGVKVHTDGNANQLNRSLHSRAFATGQDIFFKQGEYNPGNSEGQELIAHELTHVLQQSGDVLTKNEKSIQCQEVSETTTEPIIQKAPGDVVRANHYYLTLFLSSYEHNTQMVPPQATFTFLREPSLLAMAHRLRDQVRSNHSRENPPLSIQQLYELASNITSHRGTALLLCHNVTKGFARGSGALSLDPLSNEQFYQLFSTQSLGSNDTGDWYHYFAVALPAFYTSANSIDSNTPENSSGASSQGLRQGMAVVLVDVIKEAMRDSNVDSSDGYEGWLAANALSFAEGGCFGHNQREVNGESSIHIHGATTGVGQAEQVVGANWKWYVPVYRGIFGANQQNLDPNLILTNVGRMRTDGIELFTHHILNYQGELIREVREHVPPPANQSPSQSDSSNEGSSASESDSSSHSSNWFDSIPHP